jgi:hypothetical protein
MLGYAEGENHSDTPGVISAEQLADTVVAGVERERFLILPHPQVEKFRQHKADYDRWISGMRRLRGRIIDELGSTRLEGMHKLV